MEEKFPFQYCGKKRIEIIYACKNCGHCITLHQPRPLNEELLVLEKLNEQKMGEADYQMRCFHCQRLTKWYRYILPDEQEPL